jgi:hypothetical protein
MWFGLVEKVARKCGIGFQPVGQTGVLPVIWRRRQATAGKMPAGPTAKMAVLQINRLFNEAMWFQP